MVVVFMVERPGSSFGCLGSADREGLSLNASG